MEIEPPYVQKSKDYQRDYYLKHREKKLTYQKERLQTKRLEINRRRKELRLKKGLKVRGEPVLPSGLERKEYNFLHHRERTSVKLLGQKIEALQIVSGCKRPKCCKCGCSDIRVLMINHIDGGGSAERKSLGRSHARLMRANIRDGTRSPSGLDVRCANCNLLHEYERGRNWMPRGWEAILAEMCEGAP
jgi:hypothetical protein